MGIITYGRPAHLQAKARVLLDGVDALRRGQAATEPGLTVLDAVDLVLRNNDHVAELLVAAHSVLTTTRASEAAAAGASGVSKSGDTPMSQAAMAAEPEPGPMPRGRRP